MTASSRELDARAVDPQALARLAGDMEAGFSAAVARTEVVRRAVRLGGRRLEVAVASEALAARLLPAWAPFVDDGAPTSPDLVIQAWTSAPSGAPQPSAPIDLRDRWWRGVLADTPAFAAQLQGPVRILSLLDRRAAVGHWWMPDLEEVPGWESAAPFRALLHWWGPACGLHLTHAACVGVDGEGVLLAGKGGVGKSTTALSCLAAGMAFVGDDYVFTHRAEDVVTAHAAYATAKMEPQRLRAWFPRWAAHGAALTEPGGKAIVPLPAHDVTPALRVRALVLPTLSGALAPRLERAPAHAGMLALAPSTLFQLPCSGGAAVAHLAAVARELPTLRLHLGPDPAANAALLERLVRAGGQVDAL